jgi:hypothetical protein
MGKSAQILKAQRHPAQQLSRHPEVRALGGAFAPLTCAPRRMMFSVVRAAIFEARQGLAP